MLNESAHINWKSKPFKVTDKKTGEIKMMANYIIIFDDESYNVCKYDSFGEQGGSCNVVTRKVHDDSGRDYCQVLFASKKGDK